MNRLKLSPTSHRIGLCLLLFVMPLLLAAQKKLSGSVVDAVSGERLSFVMFYLASGRGTLSNFDGDFMLEIMPDDSVTITHVGYEKIRMKADLLPRIVRLKPMATQMAEVVAVGPGTEDVKMELAVGDMVIFSQYAGTEVKFEGEEYTIMGQKDILAKVEK